MNAELATPLLILAFAAIVLIAALLLARTPRRKPTRAPQTLRTIVIGPARSCEILRRFFRANTSFGYAIVGRVSEKIDDTSGSVPVLGPLDRLNEIIHSRRIQCVMIDRASAETAMKVQACVSKASNKPILKTLHSTPALVSNDVNLPLICDLGLEDLLQRHAIPVDLSQVGRFIENQVILVTGAGGSIGSEICRQLAGFNPKLLLLLGHGENSLFAIQEELRIQMHFSRTQLILADVADYDRIRSVFSRYRPYLVFHAAAHKHVPILENNICEAARNNILGTHVVALAAAAFGCSKFVLLSTDKAVEPSSVMGATKRIAELICQSFANRTSTEFVSVRFGNVLGSRGSVLSVFKQQIDTGGPLTITHRDMRRYFMSIPEAVSLVLEATSMGRDGEVVVLEMGEPISITKLAEAFVRLLGLVPYQDINITYTGVRPGEKLHEQLLTTQEGMSRTNRSGVLIARQERVDYDLVHDRIRELRAAIKSDSAASVIGVVDSLIPGFASKERVRVREIGERQLQGTIDVPATADVNVTAPQKAAAL